MTTDAQSNEDVALPPEAAAPDVAAPEDPTAALAAENAALKDQILRTLAEMENLRRRTEREVQDAKRYAVAGFARDALSVGDNLRRAIDAVPPETRASADAAVAALFDGVEMTEREFLSVLEKHGVRRIDPTGERFDPNVHQAMFEVPNPAVASGTVVQVLQAGYVIGDRVLRPALVGVAKGGPKDAGGAAEQTGETTAG